MNGLTIFVLQMDKFMDKHQILPKKMLKTPTLLQNRHFQSGQKPHWMNVAGF